ncbi:MAG: transcription antitermination factor NusB [Ruminococcaceae bacterium]|nr:transcription antitermination factor NusB [Oscillospiraceae bacterium]
MSGKTRYSRHELREAAFKILFAREFDKETEPAEFYNLFVEDTEQIDNEFVKNTFIGVIEKNAEIDTEIESYSAKWKISRMSTASRSVLRLAVYEMLYTDVPPKVAINEAVELVKIYDEDSAPSFVNGILNKIARERGLIGDTAPATEE